MRFDPLPEPEVLPILQEIGSRVGLAAQLLSHDLCWREDDLLPTVFEAGCSCPDAKNPCKHIAALTHHLARCLDRDPLVLFELRGIPARRLSAISLKPLWGASSWRPYVILSLDLRCESISSPAPKSVPYRRRCRRLNFGVALRCGESPKVFKGLEFRGFWFERGETIRGFGKGMNPSSKSWMPSMRSFDGG